MRHALIGGMGRYISLMGAALFGTGYNVLRRADPHPPRHQYLEDGVTRRLSASDERHLEAARQKRLRRRAKVLAEGRHHGR